MGVYYEEMMGFRLNRGCHGAIRKLNAMLEKRYTNYRQSDNCIVPMNVSNATGGKAVACGDIPGRNLFNTQ